MLAFIRRFIESFNGRLRDEFLNVELLFSLPDAQNKLAKWRKDFNDTRPHSALADRTPSEFAALWKDKAISCSGKRLAPKLLNTACGKPGQGCASPASAVLDSASHTQKQPLTSEGSAKPNRPRKHRIVNSSDFRASERCCNAFGPYLYL